MFEQSTFLGDFSIDATIDNTVVDITLELGVAEDGLADSATLTNCDISIDITDISSSSWLLDLFSDIIADIMELVIFFNYF